MIEERHRNIEILLGIGTRKVQIDTVKVSYKEIEIEKATVRKQKIQKQREYSDR